MAAWFDSATVTVEIAFTNSPLTANASCTWVDITTYVRNIRTNRGRQTELSDYAPGTMTLTLDNRTRLFDPSNTAGAYYGNLVPMKKVRVRASSGATSATIFTGHVMGWPIEYPGMYDSQVSVQCVDGFRALQQIAPPANAYEAVVKADSPAHYWPLDTIDDGAISPAVVGNVDIANFNQGDPSFFVPADLTITRPVGPTSTLANVGWVANSVPTAAPKTLEGWFWNFQYGVYGGTNIARAALDSTNWIRIAVSATDGTVSVGYSNSTDTKSYTYASTGWQINQSVAHLVLTVSSTNLILYANGIQRWTGTLSAATSTNTFAALPPPSVQAVAQPRAGSPVNPAIYGLAIYTAGLTSTQVTTHYQAGLTGWGHPLGDRAGTRIGRILDAIGWPILASGTATSGTTTTLVDSTKSWTVNAYAGVQVRITGGKGAGQVSTISSNTATQLTVSPAWVTAPDSTSTYSVDADRDISTGSTVLGTYAGGSSTLTACQECSVAEQGLFFMSGDGNVTMRDRQWQMTNASSITAVGTLGDQAGETNYSDIEIDGNHLENIRNVITVSYSGGGVTVSDSTSVAAYGSQSDSVSASALPSTAGYVARQLAASRLRLRKDPATRIPRVEIKARAKTATILPVVLGLELGERVTVNRRPTGGTGTFSQACIVQGIQHTITEHNWVTNLYLTPVQMTAYSSAPWLTLGDATYGRIGAAANNKIPY